MFEINISPTPNPGILLCREEYDIVRMYVYDRLSFRSISGHLRQRYCVNVFTLHYISKAIDSLFCQLLHLVMVTAGVIRDPLVLGHYLRTILLHYSFLIRLKLYFISYTCPTSREKVRRFRSSCACAKYHLDLCSLFVHSVHSIQ